MEQGEWKNVFVYACERKMEKCERKEKMMIERQLRYRIFFHYKRLTKYIGNKRLQCMSAIVTIGRESTPTEIMKIKKKEVKRIKKKKEKREKKEEERKRSF